jgi:hypothetical protein
MVVALNGPNKAERLMPVASIGLNFLMPEGRSSLFGHDFTLC